jgi:hemolysin activation/secretion protein
VLPQQNLEKNTLKVKIVEGKIENINVIGNKYTRTKYIKNALTQKEGDIIFIPEIRDELLKFNRNNDIKLKAYINKGPKFGTSDITIAVTEQKPYHVNLSFDNTGNELIGTIKEGITLQHDSLLGFRDKLTLSYDRTRSFNSYAGSYSAPIGYSGLRAGGLYNYSPLKITSGELKDLNIEGKTRNYSLFLTKPIFSTSNFSLSSTLSLNHKRSTTYIDGISLEDLLEIPSTIVNSTDLSFLAIKNDKWGQWVHSSDFALGTEMMDANSKFFKYTGSLTRFQDMGHNIQLLMRGNLQLTNNDLPSLEKFQAGGAYTVRGYSEGYLLGDNGYTVGSELRFPLFVLPEKIGNFAFRNRIQGLTFFDAGGAFQDNQQKNNIMGIGCGLRIRLSRYLFGRLDYGLGLINKAMDKSASRFYFGIESAPF